MPVTRPLLLNQIQAITFDCYGTLIDWQGGVQDTLREILRRRGLDVDEGRFFHDWEQAQWDRIQRAYAPYRKIVAGSFLQVAKSYSLPLTPPEADEFAAAIARWKPFPDVPKALKSLSRRLRLGIISNIDDDLLAGSVAQMGVEFDWKVTAQQARAYKPSDKPFRLALEQMQLSPSLVAHAAFGFEYDLGPAATVGFRTILVRRGRTQFPPQPVPDLIVSDLTELANAFGLLERAEAAHPP